MAIFSCEKNDKAHDTELVKVKDGYRVTAISGKNSHWGEYQLLFHYNQRNCVDTVWRCDKNSNILKRDTVGYFLGEDDNMTQFLQIYDKVINIDADSIERLKQDAPDSYQDSLKRSRITRRFFYKTNSKKGTLFTKEEKTMLYEPKKDFGVGSNFDNTYYKKKFSSYIYEYNSKGEIIVARIFVSDYPTIYDRDVIKTVDKTEFTYANERIVKAELFTPNSTTEESWTLNDAYTYSYEGDRLVSIKGTNYSVTFSYSGNVLTTNTNGEIVKYTMNDNGYVTKFEYPDGSYMDVVYEKGKGNYNELQYTIYDSLLGIPNIK